MSLQVCHCGWSKVTTSHGLRTHQGKMGCTLKSPRFAERATTQQLHTWSAVGLAYKQEDVLDDRADFYFDKSLQVCHCGWSKVTTYQGLRIHQGKMGCTPKGIRIPEREQCYWKHLWGKEEEQKKTRRIPKQETPQTPTVKVYSTTVKEEYNISVALSHYSSQSVRSPTASHELASRSDREGPTPAHPEAVVRPKEKKTRHPSLTQKAATGGTMGSNGPADYARIAAKTKVEPKSPSTTSRCSSQGAATSGEIHQWQDSSPDVQVKQLFRKATAPVPAVSHKEKVRKDRMLSQNASVSSRDILERAATTREDARQSASNPHGSLPRLPDSESGRQLQDSSSGVKVRQKVTGNARDSSYSLHNMKVAARMRVSLLLQKFSSTTAQDTKVYTEDKDKQVAKLTQRSSARPRQGGLDALRLQVDLMFSEVMEVVGDCQHKSRGLPLHSLRSTTVAMMGQIQQKLDKLSSIELTWIYRFTVAIKLDPTTAHRCLVSADGRKVMDAGQNQEAGDPPGGSGYVLGLDSLPAERSYWEVEVSSKTGWDVGVARGNANRQGKVAPNPQNGFWVVAHYENKAYAAMEAQTHRLPLKERPQKVGVFVDYKEGRVSFYNATAQTHVYSFTDCVFTSEIFPYFSLHPNEDGSAADPLTISPVKHH